MKQLNLYYLGGGGGGSVPDGKTVTPINDVTIWQQCAGISNPTYTTLAEILADTGILQTLMADNNAVDYMVRSKDFIGNEALVPVMTSNTTPSGEAIGIDVRSPYDFYKAFDGDNTTFFNPDSYPNNEWIGFDFGIQKYVNKVKFYSQDVLTYKIQYSDNKLTWEDATEIYSDATNLTWIEKTFTAHSARYWRLLGITNNGRMAMYTLQFAFDGICQSSDAMTYIGQNNYCANTLLADSEWRKGICNSTHFESVLNVKVPIMTSNTTPSGLASAKNYTGGFEAYKAFDGSTSVGWCGSASGTSTSNNYLEYAFGAKKKIYKADVNFSSYCTAISFRMQGINGGVVTDLTDTLNVRNGSVVFSKNINDYDSYRYQIDTYTQSVSYACPRMDEAQLYGREDV